MFQRSTLRTTLGVLGILAVASACSSAPVASGGASAVVTTVTVTTAGPDQRTVTVTPSGGATVTVTEGSTVTTTKTVTSQAPTGTSSKAAPGPQQPASQTNPLAGNAKPSQIPAAKDDALQGFYGELRSPGAGAGGTVPFVIRNDSGHPLYDLEVTGSATDASGSIVGSGSSQKIMPSVIPDGGLAIGYVYFRGDAVTKDSTFEFEPTADAEPGAFRIGVDLAVSGLNHSGKTLLGKVTNNTGKKVSGPISIIVMCFAADGTIIGTPPGGGGFAEKDGLAAGESSTFSIDLFDTACPTYLVGANGYDM